MARKLSRLAEEALARLLCYSYREIDYQYCLLTASERALVTESQWSEIVANYRSQHVSAVTAYRIENRPPAKSSDRQARRLK